MSKSLPAIFHLTHPKAGSQWIKGVFRDIAPERTRLDADAYLSYFFKEPIKPGSIYPTIYTSRATFEVVMGVASNRNAPLLLKSQMPLLKHKTSYLMNWYRFKVLRQKYRKFFVIRDLRDTLVSLYFSMRYTHLMMREEHQTFRSVLANSDEENGLIHLINSLEVQDYGRIQASWVNDADTLVVKFEDLIENPALIETVLRYCEIDISTSKLEQVLANNNFSALSARTRGEEDPNSHYRKGIAGDWKNHFTDKVKDEFKRMYGRLLIDTGYEKDLLW
ncbi:MAG: sulfotransferase domain-containing protein [Anaerolineales bacterium]|nr:sulfotransferase domain-containing protein [Anaerolineales bacterium]